MLENKNRVSNAMLLCMWGRTTTEDLALLNLKVEVTCRRNNAIRRRREQEIQGSSQLSPPPSPQSYYQMVEEHARRVKLEDFSRTTTP